MTINKVLKKFTGVNEIRINSLNLDKTVDGSDKLVIHVEPYRSKQCRCPLCNNGKKLPRYDSKNNLCTWRALDCGGVIVELQSNTPRVTCPVHGVVTAAVPWAFHKSRFTKDFDLTVTWMAKALCKSAVSQYMRISWATVGRCITRTRNYLEPDISKRLNGLKRIGIDETSYSKGHKYITTVVNHDTNTVVWVAPNHGKSVLDGFFEQLTKEERESIEVVSGDGARWITECVQQYCPQAKRCTDPLCKALHKGSVHRFACGQYCCTHSVIHLAPSPDTTSILSLSSFVNCSKNPSNTDLPWFGATHTTVFVS